MVSSLRKCRIGAHGVAGRLILCAAALFALWIGSPICRAVAAEAPEPVAVPSTTYTHANELVAIDGTRRVNVLCLGTGSPTVLFESGLALDMTNWRRVQAGVATFTRSCAYDRAGLGFSDDSADAKDADHAVEDLHRLLHSGFVKGPFVIVGHSAAGVYGDLLQARHPEDFEGAVFIDPSFPQQWRRFLESLPPARAALLSKEFQGDLDIAANCLKLVIAGAASGDEIGKCVADPQYEKGMDTTLRAEIARRYSNVGVEKARLSGFESFIVAQPQASKDDLTLGVEHVDFGDKPVVVLTAGNWFDDDEKLTPAEQLTAYSVWVAGHDELAHSSRRGKHTVVGNADHFIQLDRPAKVVEAIRDVVDDVRKRAEDPAVKPATAR